MAAMPTVRKTILRKLRVPMFLLAAGILHPLPASAQGIKSVLEALGGAPKPASPELPPAAQLDWAKSQIEIAKNDEKSEPGIISRLAEAGLPAARIEDFRAANREIQRNYQAAVDILPAFCAADGQQDKPPAVAPPASEKQASVLRDALRRASIEAESATGEEELIRRIISQNQALQTNAERESRQFQEEVDTAKSPEARARAGVQLDLANLQKRAAESAVFLGKWRSARQESLARKATAEMDALRAALRAGGFDRQMDSRRAESQLEAIEEETAVSEKALAAATKEQARLEGEAAALRDKGDSPVAKTRVAAADALADTAQRLVSVMQGNAYLLADEKAHWSAVKALSENLSPSGLKAAMAQSEDIIAKQNALRSSVDRRLIEAREGLDAAQKQLRAGVPDAATKSFIEQTATLAQKRVDALGNLVSKSRQLVTTQEEFLGELRSVLGQESPSRKASRAWVNFSRTVSQVWSFELFGGDGLRLTVGKVVMGVLGLLLALMAANGMSRWTSRTATRRFQMAEDQKMLLEKSIFIPVAAVLVLAVLYWLNIPLTVFAFLGGALAIGIGFGAQNLVNNFISGIILLLERQIKVGDIIEVAGSTGKVTHLGSRCSRIRKFDGVELLVPNSSFLEKEVTNWTLADPQHRFDFTIGVAYGSPVEKVLSLLSSALERQPEILREPAPGVFFEAFGDSALIFRIYYWIELAGATDARQVGSELRCRIERDLRVAGVQMPFPQRDLHLRTSTPIPVRLEQGESTFSREATGS